MDIASSLDEACLDIDFMEKNPRDWSARTLDRSVASSLIRIGGLLANPEPMERKGMLQTRFLKLCARLAKILETYETPAPVCEPIGDADWFCSACGVAMAGIEPVPLYCPECADNQ